MEASWCCSFCSSSAGPKGILPLWPLVPHQCDISIQSLKRPGRTPHDESGSAAAKHPIIPAKETVVFDASWDSAYRLKPKMQDLKLVHGSASSSYGRWSHSRLGMVDLEKVALRALYSPAALIVIWHPPSSVSDVLE